MKQVLIDRLRFDVYFLSSPIYLVASCPCEHSTVWLHESRVPLVLRLLEYKRLSQAVHANQQILSSVWLVTKSSVSRFTCIVIVIIILCLQNACPRKFQRFKSDDGMICMVFDDPRLRGLSSGTTTLTHCLWGPCHCPCDLLPCVTYDVMFLAGRI